MAIQSDNPSLLTTIAYFLCAAGLLIGAYFIFRHLVLRDYLTYGNLKRFTSLLQLLVFMGVMSFPYIYNPPNWPNFWKFVGGSQPWYANLGFVIILLGFVLAFGTMFWFGIQRAFGRKVEGLIQTGPYRYSRNPQILGGYLLVVGVAMQIPSWYALGWSALYGIIGHLMIITEEEFLRKQCGDIFEQFCQEVPRYLSVRNVNF